MLWWCQVLTWVRRIWAKRQKTYIIVEISYNLPRHAFRDYLNAPNSEISLFLWIHRHGFQEISLFPYYMRLDYTGWMLLSMPNARDEGKLSLRFYIPLPGYDHSPILHFSQLILPKNLF